MTAAIGQDPLLLDSDTESLRALRALRGRPDWLEELRAPPLPSDLYVVWEHHGDIRSFVVPPGFARLGRSLSADLRLDDPTVSRSHALLHREGDRVTVLEDRSLNGVLVNGRRVSWQQLEHGDEIQLGACRLYFLEL